MSTELRFALATRKTTQLSSNKPQNISSNALVSGNKYINIRSHDPSIDSWQATLLGLLWLNHAARSQIYN